MNFENTIRKARSSLPKIYPFFPVLYYGFLFVYCLVLVFLHKGQLPALAYAPFLYSFLVPLVLLLLLPLIFLIAFLLYWRWKFLLRSLAWLLGFALILFLVVILFVALIVVTSDADFELLRIHKGDVIFVFLYLWGVPIQTFLSMEDQNDEKSLALNWLGRIGRITAVSLFQQMMISIPAFLITIFFLGIGHIHEAGHIFFSLIYFGYALCNLQYYRSLHVPESEYALPRTMGSMRYGRELQRRVSELGFRDEDVQKPRGQMTQANEGTPDPISLTKADEEGRTDGE